jgi:hypothetical protein
MLGKVSGNMHRVQVFNETSNSVFFTARFAQDTEVAEGELLCCTDAETDASAQHSRHHRSVPE